MKRVVKLLILLSVVLLVETALSLNEVPVVIEQPGTQPGEVGNPESPDKCDNCHGGYNKAVEPAFNWRGSAMGNAGRDPIFWATLAIAEQDFPGSGDLCLRCHSTGGWLAGRSTPTDGSGLAAGDDDGVDCDTCHKMTNPDNTEYLGEQFAPYVANDGNSPAEGYYGSGMLSIWGGSDKLGPYGDAEARHQYMQSDFHRDADFCGSCHDVSNPAVGNLAPNNGAQATADPVVADGVLSGTVDGKAAFNNPPYMYGIVERTFSEFQAGGISKTLVSDFPSLPADLQSGALLAGYESALVAGREGNYADGTRRFFSCQTCHMRPVNGPGCNKKGTPVRKDLPLHDMTGGNYWLADIIKYQDAGGLLRLGGNLTPLQIEALGAGAVRAKKQLSEAVSLIVEGDNLRVVNHTGHKVISGYPEGRRMWLNIKWYNGENNLIREDGAYGPLFNGNGNPVTVANPAGGPPVQVESILDLNDPNTKVYEAHYAISKNWAEKLISVDPAYGDLVLSYDRYSGAAEITLAGLQADPQADYHDSFHFVLNNMVSKDNRIPPYGMSYEEARRRNALPVPNDQYGGAPGGIYNYWDDFALNPPSGAAYAEINMLYQGTSWEYIQFLAKENKGVDPALGGNAFLGEEGVNMLEAWLNTGMVKPYVMASTVWGTAPAPAVKVIYTDSLITYLSGKRNSETLTDTFRPRDTIIIKAHVVDSEGSPLSGAQVFMDVKLNGITVASLQGFSDETGTADLAWKTSRRQNTGLHTAAVNDILKSGYQYDPGLGQVSVEFLLQ